MAHVERRLSAIVHNPSRAFAWMLAGLLLSALVAEVAHGLKGSTDWTIVLLARTWGGLLFALLWARASGTRLKLSGPPALWVRTLAATLGLPCTFYAYSQLPAAEALLLVSTAPLLVAVFSALFFGQAHRPAVWAAVVVGLVGVGVIERPHVLAGNLGAVAALGSAVAVAVAMMAIARLRHVVDAPAMVVHATAGATLSGTALVLLQQHWRVDLAALPWLVLLAGMATASQLTTVRALSGGNTPTLAASSYLIVPMGLGLDALLWASWPDGVTLAGMGIVLVPILYLVLRPRELGLTRSRRAVAVTLPPEQEGLRRIEAAIGRAERATSCEFRVHVDRYAAPPERRARALFAELGMSETQRRNGILLYVNLGGGVAVHADEGASGLVAARTLDAICAKLALDLERAPLETAVEAALDRLATELAGAFPYPDDDVDELPNVVSISA